MSSDSCSRRCRRPVPARRTRRNLSLLLLAVAVSTQLACGHKKPPFPPPSKIPQRANVAIHQRGSEAILTIEYPTLTISGTALDGISRIEVWRYGIEVPVAAIDVFEDEKLRRAEAEALLDELGLSLFDIPQQQLIDPNTLFDPANPATHPEGYDPDDPATYPDPADPTTFLPLTAFGLDPDVVIPPPVAGVEGEGSGLEDATTATGAVPGSPPADGSDLERVADDPEGEEELIDLAAELTEEELLAIQVEAARTLLLAPPTLKERFMTATASDFAKGAEKILEVTQAEIPSTVVGEKIVLRTPLPPPAPPQPARPKVASTPDDETPSTGEGEAALDPATDDSDAQPAAPGDEGDEGDGDEGGEGGESSDDAVPPREPEFGFLYAVQLYPVRGKPSDYSTFVAVLPTATPPAPADLVVEAGPLGVDLAWTAEEDPEEGFRVYRREAQTRLYGDPVMTLPGSTRVFTDRQAVFGARYIYGVTALARSSPLLESDLSSEHEVDYQDRFGPLAPTGLAAFPETGRVRLIWNASTAIDVGGYQVLRRATIDDEATAVNSELATRSSFIDDTVAAGEVWLYSVVAIDQLGNESPASAEISVRVP